MRPNVTIKEDEYSTMRGIAKGIISVLEQLKYSSSLVLLGGVLADRLETLSKPPVLSSFGEILMRSQASRSTASAY
jgi:hypothetical protein